MTTTVSAGSSASFYVGAFDSISVTASNAVGTLAFNSSADNLKSDTTANLQNKVYGPFGVPGLVVISVVQGSIGYDFNVGVGAFALDSTGAPVSGGGSGNVAGDTHAATSKTTPVDGDEIPLADSAASFGLKKVTWLNLKANLKTYLDTLYQATLVSGTNLKSINGTSLLGSGDLTISGGGTTVENVLTSTSTTNALSAAMGKSLKDTADTLATTVAGKVATSSIVNDLTTGGTAVPLSAEQGKTLQANKADYRAGVVVTAGFTVAATSHADRIIAYNSGSAGNATFNTGHGFSDLQAMTLVQVGAGAITALQGTATVTAGPGQTVTTTGPGSALDVLWSASASAFLVTNSSRVYPTVTSGAAGLAPASGGGTTNFLRADGSWAAPAGGSSSVATIAPASQFNPTAGVSTSLFSVTIPANSLITAGKMLRVRFAIAHRADGNNKKMSATLGGQTVLPEIDALGATFGGTSLTVIEFCIVATGSAGQVTGNTSPSNSGSNSGAGSLQNNVTATTVDMTSSQTLAFFVNAGGGTNNQTQLYGGNVVIE